MRWVRLFGLAMGAACAREAAPVAPPPPAIPTAPPVEAPHVSQYQLGDGLVPLKLDGVDSFGAIVNGLRVVQVGRVTHAAAQETSPPLQDALKLSASLGGGFLFRSKNALFVGATFDGPLRPLIGFLTDIESLKVGPSYVLVRLSDGDRVGIDPRTGQRAALAPPGLVDVAAIDDGRTAALTTFGAALVSSDGKQWTDVTAQLGAAPDGVDVVDGELWIHTSNTSARVDEGGHVTLFDEEKTATPLTLRPRDPRWHESTTPLRKAIRSGAMIDETTAVVVTQGALARIDVATGALISLSSVRLPTDADCEGVRTPDDVLFVCRRSGEAFVAAHGLAEQAFGIEQSFAQSGTFYAGDDGALAFQGACSGAPTNDIAVCVRGPGGSWQEHIVNPNVSDGGAATVTSVDRWVPKLDGNAIGLTFGGSPTMVDARTGEVTLLPPDALAIADTSTSRRGRSYGKRAYSGWQIDRAWTATPSGVRGWLGKGTAIDVGTDGSVVRAPYAFDQAVTNGNYGFALTADSAFQSTDRGQHWTEVAAPPHAHTPQPALSIDACGAMGCDLGGYFRVGWDVIAPMPPSAPDVLSAPKLPITTLPAITCTPLGSQKIKVANRSPYSPTDLAMGAAKATFVPDHEDEIVHEVGAYWLQTPLRSVGDSGDGDGEPSFRSITTGYGVAQADDGTLKANGPVPSIALLRRQVGYVQAFDPQLQVRRSSIGMADYFAAARAAGLGSSATSLDSDPLTTETVVPLLGKDPAANDDIVISYTAVAEGGAFAIVRPNGSRMTLEKDKPDGGVSFLGAAQVGDDVALLQGNEDGSEQVFRWTGLALSALFEVPAPPNRDFSLANPDALAIGPHSEIGIVRTPSGGQPATKDDAALLYLPGQAPSPLAPWSTLTLADDPACKADPGWRLILTTTRPWLRAATPDMELSPSQSFMRVKWSATRVCLEGLETHLVATTKTRVQMYDSPTERPSASPVVLSSWLTWKVLGTAAAPAGAGRGGAGAGFEMSQPMKCSL